MKIKTRLALATLYILPAIAFAEGHVVKHEPTAVAHSSAEATEHKGKASHVAHKDSPCTHEERARTQAATERAPDTSHETASVTYPPGFATGPSSNDNVE
ncbi:MAG: hypothetical protein EKK49_01405 [Rhodocyclaceae bacterium]|nr:MAG: hypothetical protein EKK49_01405 [Rhodocyclaceae bacterium]